MEVESSQIGAALLPLCSENLPHKNGKVPHKELQKMQENQGVGVHLNGVAPHKNGKVPHKSEKLPHNPPPNERKENSETISSSIPGGNAVDGVPTREGI